MRSAALMSGLLFVAAIAPLHAERPDPTTSHRTAPGGRGPSRATMAAIPPGMYRPLYARSGAGARVSAFTIDRALVTRAEFLAFVRANPVWRRSAIRPPFAEAGYLENWPSDLDAGGAADLRRPVTNVSWFAAKAYCAAQGKRLPRTSEWDAASEVKRDATRDRAFLGRLVALYTARPRATGITNVYGVRSMHGPVWEWTLEVNGGVVPDDSHSSSGGMHVEGGHLFCASAAIGASDLTNYPAFLRAAIRAGLTGRTTLDGLGFRCAGDAAT